MRILLDTNIFLEILLGQDRAAEARALLSSSGDHQFFLTDFTLHSIGLGLFRRGRHDAFIDFYRDTLLNIVSGVLSISGHDLYQVASVAIATGLDFDDSYQYAVARNYGLTIVSYDSDFDRTELGRKTPSEILHG